VGETGNDDVPAEIGAAPFSILEEGWNSEKTDYAET